MNVKDETFYHYARTKEAEKMFDCSDRFEWPASKLNHTTKELHEFFPKLDLQDGKGPRGVLDAILKLHELGSKTLIPHKEMHQILTTANRRYLESVLEKIRAELHPDLPSRHNCIFLSRKEDLKDWISCLSVKSGETLSIYEFSVTGPVHFADHRWLDSDIFTQDMYEIYARNYWEGKPFDDKLRTIWEILATGTLIKKRKIEFVKDHGEIQI